MRIADFLCRGPESKYFRLLWAIESLILLSSSNTIRKQPQTQAQASGCGGMQQNFYFRHWKFNCIPFECQEYYLIFFQIFKNHLKLASHPKIGRGPIWPRAHSFLTLGLECLLMPGVNWGERLWTIGFPKGFDPGLWTWAMCSYIPMTLLEIMWILAPRGSSPAASLPRAVPSPTSSASSHPFASSLYGVTPWKAWPAQEEYLTTAWSFGSLLKRGLREERWSRGNVKASGHSSLTGKQALGEAGMNKGLG